MSDTPLLILTGASRGLGAALAQALVQPGHRLICVTRGDNTELRVQAATAGVTLDWHQVGLSDARITEAWMAETLAVLSAFAKATLVLSIGAVESTGTVDTLCADTLLPHLQLNLAGPMALIAALLRGTAPWNMQRHVLAILSGAVRRPTVGWAAYCTGEAGLGTFVRAISANGDTSMRAVALVPGVIDTGMQRTIRGANFAGVQRFCDLHTHGELASPQDVAVRIAAYLVRPDLGTTELGNLRNIV